MMMNRQFVVRTLHPVRNHLKLSQVVDASIHYSSSRLASSPLIAKTTHHVKCIQSTPFSTDADSNSNSGQKIGIVARIRQTIRTIFGSNDDSPRGVQERKDMYWILLAVTHRKLRMEAQLQQQHHHHQQQQQQMNSRNNTNLLEWSSESKDQIEQYMDEAASPMKSR